MNVEEATLEHLATGRSGCDGEVGTASEKLASARLEEGGRPYPRFIGREDGAVEIIDNPPPATTAARGRRGRKGRWR